jgi:hypothetical protein
MRHWPTKSKAERYARLLSESAIAPQHPTDARAVLTFKPQGQWADAKLPRASIWA